MSDLVTVRRAVREDREEMVRLMKGYLDFYEKPYPPEEKMHALLDTLERQPERGLQFIAEADGRAVGFATLYSTFSTLRAQEAMVMNDLYAEASVRGKGVGKALFDACREYVQENGYAFLEWVTADDNVNAQTFYERQGAQKSSWIVYSV